MKKNPQKVDELILKREYNRKLRLWKKIKKQLGQTRAYGTAKGSKAHDLDI